MELVAIKIRTVVSNNDYIIIFESGDISKPILLIADYQAKDLVKQIQKALESE